MSAQPCGCDEEARWVCERHRVDQAQCPQCKAWVDDMDGFGVLRHEACGYCSHASVTGAVCGLCGESV